MQLFPIALFVLAACIARSTSHTFVEESNALDVLPMDIRKNLKLTHQEPISFKITCSVRSLSVRNINLTHYLHDGPSMSMKIEPGERKILIVDINDILKINEVLDFGGGDDAAAILGEDLATYPITENSTFFAFHEKLPEHRLDPIPAAFLQEEQFYTTYLEENGIAWHHYYNASAPPPTLARSHPLRGPPSMHMWGAEEVGQTHEVFSKHGHWTCDGFASLCQTQETLPLTLTTVSTSPRAFIIPNFLNAYECDRIVQLAQTHMNVSLTGGGHASEYRTSLTAWLNRRVSPVIDSLYRRAADLLNVDEKEMVGRSELLQIVNYHFGEEYKSHFDWSIGEQMGGRSRYLTLLLYLTDQVDEDSGGETLFPNAQAGALALRPVKGTAALFYNLLPDGNGDPASLHQSLPVKRGEKWLANMWIWDPYK